MNWFLITGIAFTFFGAWKKKKTLLYIGLALISFEIVSAFILAKKSIDKTAA